MKCMVFLFAVWLGFTPGLAFSEPEERTATSSSLSNPGGRPVQKPRVSCTLSLARYQFWINMVPGIGNADGRDSFSAVFSLTNKSGEDIAFDLISHCGEEKPVQFILRNAEDEILWQYIVINPLMACPDYLENKVLPNNGTFHHGAAVPLVIDGDFLEPGEYSLEAFVDGYPCYGAYAPFRVDYEY